MKKLFLLLILCIPCFGFDGTTGWITITNTNLQIISDGSPRAFIYVTTTNDGCTNHTPKLVMDNTNPLGGAMYATLLMAKATGKQVQITTVGCSSDGFPIVQTIYIGS